MDDKVVVILTNIIRQYGTNICNEPKKLKGLLSDLCNNCRKEINVLIMALQQNIVASLLNISDIEIDNITYKKLTQKLYDESGLSVESSNWAVETWCTAFGKKLEEISSHDIESAANQKFKKNESITTSYNKKILIYDLNGYDKNGFSREGICRNGTRYNEFGYDVDGYNKKGFNINGFYKNGMHLNGTLYDCEGYDKNGNLRIDLVVKK